MFEATSRRVLLTAPAYELGEIVEPTSELPDLASRAAELAMPIVPDLWGWGDYRRTDRDLADLAICAGRASLAAGRVDPAGVDGLILCSTRFAGGAEAHGGFVQRITTGLGIGNVAYYGLTLHRCANLLAALDLAGTLVAAGRHRRILVITTDLVRPGDSRIESYAIFSDGAAGCLVTDDPVDGDCYEMLASGQSSVPEDLGSDGEISADLAVAVNRQLLSGRELAVSDLAALMHANLVIPLLSMKERQAGFGAGQLYLDNIRRFGHCFAADPLINLVDRAALGHVAPGDHLMLATSVPGERYSVLLRCRVLAATEAPADRRAIQLAGLTR